MNSNNLKKAIKAARLTQARLAEEFEVAPNTVWRWTAGVSEPDDATKKRLAELLKVPISYLMEESEEKNVKHVEVTTTKRFIGEPFTPEGEGVETLKERASGILVEVKEGSVSAKVVLPHGSSEETIARVFSMLWEKVHDK